MNKADLMEQVSAKTGLTEKVSGEAVNALILAITESLTWKEKVTLVGFGTFKVTKRKGTRKVNPQTGEIIQIPPKDVPKFVPGKNLREAVR